MDAHKRAEHWIVVSGTALVTVGETVSIDENESTYMPLGTVHALENRAVHLLKSSRYKPALILVKTILSV